MKKVLIIEDDPKMQKLYSEALSQHDIETVAVESANQAGGALQTSIPDLIVLDIMLPGGKNGFDFLEEIRKDPRYKSIQVLVVTALDSEQATAERIGVAGYIVKTNTSLTEIVKKIAALVG